MLPEAHSDSAASRRSIAYLRHSYDRGLTGDLAAPLGLTKYSSGPPLPPLVQKTQIRPSLSWVAAIVRP
jgi:hypothetical protein